MLEYKVYHHWLMQSKPIIKLELSHYNSVPENIINHPPPKIEPKMK